MVATSQDSYSPRPYFPSSIPIDAQMNPCTSIRESGFKSTILQLRIRTRQPIPEALSTFANSVLALYSSEISSDSAICCITVGFMNIHLPSEARNWKYVATGHLFAPISESRLQKLVKRCSISPEPWSRSYRALAKGS